MSPEADRRIPTPLSVALRAQDAVFDATASAIRRAAVIDERVEDAASVAVGESPAEVVYRENKLELLHFEGLTDHQHEVPILIVYALINRPYILDLQPDRSIVRRLLEAGHDVYLIDWNEPSRLDQHLGLGDYVARYMDNCVDTVRERTGAERVNLLGYCMGGTMAAIYTAIRPGKVNALGLMATGLYFDDTGGVLERWGTWFDPRDVTETYGNVPGTFLDVGFALMDPVANYATKYIHLADRLENEDFVRNFARMETWLGESVDVAGAAFAEFVEQFYQANELGENTLTIDGEAVDLSTIAVPILQIVGEYDHLVPPAASTPFADLVGSDDVTTIQYPSGHVGLAMSERAHRDVWPEVAEWFAEQTAHPALADVIGQGVEAALGVDVETDITAGDAGELEIGVADETGEIVREIIPNDADAIERFLERALGIEIGLDSGVDGIAVSVSTDGETVTTVVETVGAAIRDEVQEAVDRLDVAATDDLEDVRGIGPTYAGRLRAAGIETVTRLALTDEREIATAAQTSTAMARNWIDRARRLAGVREDESD